MAYREYILEFYIYEQYTIVKSQITFQKNNFQNISFYNLDSHLELNGVDLETTKFELILDDNSPKNIKIENLKKQNEAVIIPVNPTTSVVKIITEVKLYPSNNNSLEGLHHSNNLLCTP